MLLETRRQADKEEGRRLDEDLHCQEQEEGTQDYDAPSLEVPVGSASKIAFSEINKGTMPNTATLPVVEWARAALAKGKLALL